VRAYERTGPRLKFPSSIMTRFLRGFRAAQTRLVRCVADDDETVSRHHGLHCVLPGQRRRRRRRRRVNAAYRKTQRPAKRMCSCGQSGRPRMCLAHSSARSRGQSACSGKAEEPGRIIGPGSERCQCFSLPIASVARSARRRRRRSRICVRVALFGLAKSVQKGTLFAAAEWLAKGVFDPYAPWIVAPLFCWLSLALLAAMQRFLHACHRAGSGADPPGRSPPPSA
jgi:hypothetical protein